MNCSTDHPPRQAPPDARRRCLLCGRPPKYIGVFTPNDQLRRMLLYSLCGHHALNSATFERVEDAICWHLHARGN